MPKELGTFTELKELALFNSQLSGEKAALASVSEPCWFRNIDLANATVGIFGMF